MLYGGTKGGYVDDHGHDHWYGNTAVNLQHEHERDGYHYARTSVGPEGWTVSLPDSQLYS